MTGSLIERDRNNRMQRVQIMSDRNGNFWVCVSGIRLFLIICMWVIGSSILLMGCSFHTHANQFNGVSGTHGEPVEYQQTNTWALHALWIYPLAGDATLENAVNEFSTEAKKRGATRINIEESSSFTYWFILPPFSFFVHPVNATISGNVEGTAGKDKK